MNQHALARLARRPAATTVYLWLLLKAQAAGKRAINVKRAAIANALGYRKLDTITDALRALEAENIIKTKQVPCNTPTGKRVGSYIRITFGKTRLNGLVLGEASFGKTRLNGVSVENSSCGRTRLNGVSSSRRRSSLAEPAPSACSSAGELPKTTTQITTQEIERAMTDEEYRMLLPSEPTQEDQKAG